MKKLAIYFGSAIIAFMAISQSVIAEPEQVQFKTMQLKASNQTMYVQVARTSAEHEYGLMHRKFLPKNHGMLFVFDRPAQVCMWMKNTPIHLSVAFLDADGRILNVEEMKANTTDSHCAKGWVRYAIEMNRGWFSKHKLSTGDLIRELPKQ